MGNFRMHHRESTGRQGFSASQYEALVDVTDFATVHSYLRSEESPIHILVFVKSGDLLGLLAEKFANCVDQGMGGRAMAQQFFPPLFAAGLIRIASRHLADGA